MAEEESRNPDQLFLVYVSDFAGRPRAQLWRQRSYAVDTKAEAARVLKRIAVPAYLACLDPAAPIDVYVEAFPYEAAA